MEWERIRLAMGASGGARERRNEGKVDGQLQALANSIVSSVASLDEAQGLGLQVGMEEGAGGTIVERLEGACPWPTAQLLWQSAAGGISRCHQDGIGLRRW